MVLYFSFVEAGIFVAFGGGPAGCIAAAIQDLARRKRNNAAPSNCSAITFIAACHWLESDSANGSRRQKANH